MRKSGTAEKYWRVVQEMYEDGDSGVVRVTDGCNVGVGLHQDLF